MSYGRYAVFTVSAASGATSTSVIDLGTTWEKLAFSIPASITFDIYVQASDSATGTFKRCYHEPNVANSTTTFAIASTTSNVIVQAIDMPYRFLKFEHSTASGGNTPYTYKIFAGG